MCFNLNRSYQVPSYALTMKRCIVGLPVQVRDHALQIQDDIPKQGASRDYYIQNQERELALTDGTTPGGALAKITDAGNSCLFHFSWFYLQCSLCRNFIITNNY